MQTYSSPFYKMLTATSQPSASLIVPIVMDLVQPRSVIDLGCGPGAWLAVFKQAGVETVLGVDGDFIDRTSLQIAAAEFQAHDLNIPFAAPKRYDLAMSVEVGEHLKPASARMFVGELAGLSDVVLFSAAIPYQGGDGHINQQWPSYWAALFKERGYIAIDCIRDRIWNDSSVSWWFAQNLLVYANEAALERHPQLAALRRPGDFVRDMVHPRLWDKKVGIPKRKKEKIKALFRFPGCKARD